MQAFTIKNIKYTDTQINASVLLEPKSEVFAAHFPDYPLLPGVVMLNMVRQVCEKQFNKAYTWKNCSRVKFLQPIHGDSAKLLAIKINIASENPIQISASIVYKDAIVFKLIQGELF